MTLTERQNAAVSKLGALALLAAVLIICTQLLVVPVIGAAASHGAEMAVLRERLSAVDAEVARVPALKEHIATLAASPLNGDGLWTGGNDNTISVAIQSKVRQLLQSAGANISRLDAAVSPDPSGYRRYTMRMAFAGGDKELADVLVALARQRPYLRIESLSVRGSEINRPSTPGDPVFATVVNVELELSGLGQNSGAPP